MLKATVYFWTNGRVGGNDDVEPGDAWYAGMVYVPANTRHGIRALERTVPFNHPEELQAAIERAVEVAGITLHVPPAVEAAS